MQYTKEEEQFLIENYPIYGAKYCSIKLNRGMGTVGNKARKLGLKAGREKHISQQKIPVDQFLDIKTKEVAYFLGFFWADGHIHHYKVKNSNHWRIALEIVEKDAINIKPILDNLGQWVIIKRKRKDSWQETWTFFTANKALYLFLEENGFKDKSLIEPEIILNKIPEDLKKYFWKGFIDGDGHISCKEYTYKGSKKRHSTFELSGQFGYKWLEIKKLFNLLNIKKYKIYNLIDKNGHKRSKVKVYSKEVLKLDSIIIDYGLNRKNKNFYLIKERYNDN